MPAIILPDGEKPEEIAGVFALLARLWASETDAATLTSLARPPVADVWRSLGGEIPNRPTDDLLEELAVDYCQILIGPGDHASPVSDTTVLASLGAGSDHMDHVITQLPYALSMAGLTFLIYVLV